MRRWAAPFFALFALVVTAAPAQESAVSLPPFLVEEAAKGPPTKPPIDLRARLRSAW